VSNTTFESGGVKLVGRLIMPPGNGKVPVVVLIHGSEHSSGIDTLFLQRIFPAQGIGAFVYDKRGTGRSGGVYTQDCNLLASDAMNAMNEARRLTGARLERIGYWGGSQGGWVVPLAANKAPVDFGIIGYGLAVKVIDEDQESVTLDMYFHHHSAADTAKALELSSAGEHVVATHGMDGYAKFDALRQKYKSESWYKDVRGDYLFMILPLDQKEIIETIKPFAATPFNYDPMPVLRASTTPQLWILGGSDLDAPRGETSRRIKSLIAEGKDYTLAVYPGAEHGITLYELGAKGERISTRYAPGYFAMMRDFIRSGRLAAITIALKSSNQKFGENENLADQVLPKGSADRGGSERPDQIDSKCSPATSRQAARQCARCRAGPWRKGRIAPGPAGANKKVGEYLIDSPEKANVPEICFPNT
jgi:pimeloyl-ACP methyl ester carboxylesterase